MWLSIASSSSDWCKRPIHLNPKHGGCKKVMQVCCDGDMLGCNMMGSMDSVAV